MLFPPPLRPGDRIGVTSPSSGVPLRLHRRLDHAVGWLRARGYDVVVGECMDGESHVSAPKEQRAAELEAMLRDPDIRAVVPPWGGETAIDLLDQLDWPGLADAEPTWVVGFSDTDTWMLPLTLRLGWATLYGTNLMDTPYAPVDGLVHWTDLAAATAPVTQRATGVSGRNGYRTWETDGTDEAYVITRAGTWATADGGPVDVCGRLVGGCIETLGAIAGTTYGDVRAFGAAHEDEGLLVYLEAAEWPAPDICRVLHGLRYAGWFEHANGILVASTDAPDVPTLTQRQAVGDALGMLGLPIVYDVECGHVPPYLPLVNGALARVVVDGDRCEITQELG